MKRLNTDLPFITNLTKELEEMIIRDFNGRVDDWKKTVVISRLTEAVNSVKRDQRSDQPTMNLQEARKWGRIQKAFMESTSFIVELHEDEVVFLSDTLEKATFDPKTAMFVLPLADAIIELRLKEEENTNTANHPITLNKEDVGTKE